MVSLSTDDDRQLGSVRLLSVSETLEGFEDLRVLFVNDSIELSLRDTIAVNNNSAWQHLLVFLVELETFVHHALQLGDHLVGCQCCSVFNP